MNSITDCPKKISFLDLSHLSLQAGVVAADWVWLNKSIHQISDIQKEAQLLAMMSSGSIQVVRPMIEGYIADGFGWITNNRLDGSVKNEIAAKVFFDLLPFVILVGSSYFNGIPMRMDLIANLCFRALPQLGVQKMLCPDVRAEGVAKAKSEVQTENAEKANSEVQTENIEKTNSEVQTENIEKTNSEAKVVLVESSGQTLVETLSNTRRVTFADPMPLDLLKPLEALYLSRCLTSSPVEESQAKFYQSSFQDAQTTLNLQNLKNFYDTNSDENILKLINDHNKDKDFSYLIYPEGAINVQLTFKRKERGVKEIQEWLSQKDKEIDVLEIIDRDIEQLEELLLAGDQSLEVLHKISTLKLGKCKYSISLLDELKEKYPNICAFDVRESAFVDHASNRGAEMKANSSSLKLKYILIQKNEDQCISNLPSEINNYNNHIINMRRKYLNELTPHTTIETNTKKLLSLMPKKEQLPICAFIQEVSFLKALVNIEYKKIIQLLAENYPFLRSLDLSWTPISYTEIPFIFKKLQLQDLNLTNCNRVFYKKDKDFNWILQVEKFSGWNGSLKSILVRVENFQIFQLKENPDKQKEQVKDKKVKKKFFNDAAEVLESKGIKLTSEFSKKIENKPCITEVLRPASGIGL